MAARLHNIVELLALGTPVQIGVIAATTSKNNHDTAVPFKNTGAALGNLVVVLQPDVQCWIKFGAGNTVTAANSDLRIEAHERVAVSVHPDFPFLACLSSSGTTNLRVYQMV